MGTYAKGYMASIGAVFTTAMQVSDQFCGTWWPAVVGFATALGVVVVPNAKKSDDLK